MTGLIEFARYIYPVWLACAPDVTWGSADLWMRNTHEEDTQARAIRGWDSSQL